MVVLFLMRDVRLSRMASAHEVPQALRTSRSPVLQEITSSFYGSFSKKQKWISLSREKEKSTFVLISF